MATQTCPECGNPFDTVMPKGTPCGLRACPSGQAGYGKPGRTTARGRPIDDQQIGTGSKRVTGRSGYVQQRTTGFGLLDAALGYGRTGKAKGKGKRR